MKYKILITWRLLAQNINLYKNILKKNNINYDILHTEQHAIEKILLDKIDKYDGLICGDDEITKKVIDKAKKLKIICKWGTGTDSIDKINAKKKNIKVFNTPGAFTRPVSQHAVGLMFSLLRNIVWNDQDLRSGLWTKRSNDIINDKIVGIIGYGKIGKEIKRILNPFKLKFYINDIKKLNNQIVPFSKVLKNSDILFISCDLNPSSKHLIRLKDLKKMKKESIIVNISRGAIIKNSDLIKALKQNVIKAAGLDVFENEPLKSNSAFLKLKNCILTSHNAFYEKSLVKKINSECIRKITNFFKKI